MNNHLNKGTFLQTSLNEFSLMDHSNEYNREHTKQQVQNELINCLQNTFQEMRQKADELNSRQQPNLNNIYEDDISANLDKLQSQWGHINTTLNSLTQKQNIVKKKIYQNLQPNLQSLGNVLRAIVDKKTIPVKCSKTITDAISDMEKTIQQIKIYISSLTKGWCCGCGGNKAKNINIDEAIISLKQIVYFWQTLNQLEPKQGFVEKHCYPDFPIQHIQNTLKQLLEKLMPHQPSPKVEIKTEYIPQEVPVIKPQVEVQQKFVEDNLRLGYEFMYGINEDQDFNKGKEIFLNEAANNNCSALLCLGKIYLDGKYASQNIGEAFNYYYKAYQMESSEACFYLGYMIQKDLLNEQQIKLVMTKQPKIQHNSIYAKKLYKKAISINKNAKALTQLGEFYQFGVIDQANKQIIKQDLDKAQKFYKKASKKQYPKALNNLAILIMDSNKEKAINYLKQASALKYAKASLNLGSIYLNDFNVSSNLIDLEQAMLSFREAALLKNIEGELNYAKTLIMKAHMLFMVNQNNLDRSQIELLYNEAAIQLFDLYLKKINIGEVYYLLGTLFDYGYGVKKDQQMALQLYKLGANNNQPSANAIKRQADYAWHYSCNNTQKQIKAVSLYKQASKLNGKCGYKDLGAIYEDGLFGAANYQKASKYYKKAATANDGDASIFLYNMMATQKIQGTEEDKLQHLAKSYQNNAFLVSKYVPEQVWINENQQQLENLNQ